jgi:hypothetical protein
MLEASDPCWLRLTQSLKTVLAVLLTMAFLNAGQFERESILQLSPAVYHLHEVCQGLQQSLANQVPIVWKGQS